MDSVRSSLGLWCRYIHKIAPWVHRMGSQNKKITTSRGDFFVLFCKIFHKTKCKKLKMSILSFIFNK